MTETCKIPSNNSLIDLKTYYNSFLEGLNKNGFKNLIDNHNFETVIFDGESAYKSVYWTNSYSSASAADVFNRFNSTGISYLRTLSNNEKNSLEEGSNVIFTITYYRESATTTPSINITSTKIGSATSNITLTEIENSSVVETIDTFQVVTKSFSGTLGAISSNNLSFNITKTNSYYYRILNMSLYQGNVLISSNLLNNKNNLDNMLKISSDKLMLRNGLTDNDFESIASEEYADLNIATHNTNEDAHEVGYICGLTETQTLSNKTLESPIINSGSVDLSGTAILKTYPGSLALATDKTILTSKAVYDKIEAITVGIGDVGVHNIRRSESDSLGSPTDLHGLTSTDGRIIGSLMEVDLTRKNLTATGNKINGKSFVDFNTEISTNNLATHIPSNSSVVTYVGTIKTAIGLLYDPLLVKRYGLFKTYTQLSNKIDESAHCIIKSTNTLNNVKSTNTCLDTDTIASGSTIKIFNGTNWDTAFAVQGFSVIKIDIGSSETFKYLLNLSLNLDVTNTAIWTTKAPYLTLLLGVEHTDGIYYFPSFDDTSYESTYPFQYTLELKCNDALQNYSGSSGINFNVLLDPSTSPTFGYKIKPVGDDPIMITPNIILAYLTCGVTSGSGDVYYCNINASITPA